MLTNRATRLEVSQGHQTWYHSICYVWFPISYSKKKAVWYRHIASSKRDARTRPSRQNNWEYPYRA